MNWYRNWRLPAWGAFLAVLGLLGSQNLVSAQTVSANAVQLGGITYEVCADIQAGSTAANTCPPDDPDNLPPVFLLPDLTPLPPGDLSISTYMAGERRILRLTTSFANIGPGRLELTGRYNPERDKTIVLQYVYGEEDAVLEHPAGEFIFHPAHDHWHMENFVRYELWTLTNQGHLDQIAALTDKVSFCLRDNSRADTGRLAQPAQYFYCGNELQGISSGWVDTYRYDTPGQLIDITDLPDGLYALRLVVDPLDQILEKNKTNNSARVTLDITGRKVRILTDPQEVRSRLSEQDPYLDRGGFVP